MGWTDERERLQALAQEIDPAVCLTTKNGWFWKAVAWLLLIVTFGAMKRDRFLNDFATTLGPIQAYPEEWPVESVERVLIHESRHTQQARWFSLFIHPWVGLPVMALVYLFLPVPILGAVGRAGLELDAEAFAWKRIVNDPRWGPKFIRKRARNFADTVSDYAYVWTMPRCVLRKWYVSKAEEVIREA